MGQGQAEAPAVGAAAAARGGSLPPLPVEEADAAGEEANAAMESESRETYPVQSSVITVQFN